MRRTIFLIIILNLILGCNYYSVQPIVNPDLPEKEQAREFSLRMVQTYFENDCDTFYRYLSDPIYLLDDDGPIEKNAEVNEKICNSVGQAVKGEHTYNEYLESYNVTILEKVEYELKYPQISSLQNFKSTSSDYLFFGMEIKEGYEEFMWDDMLVFMVRKTSDGWKISALSG